MFKRVELKKIKELNKKIFELKQERNNLTRAIRVYESELRKLCEK